MARTLTLSFSCPDTSGIVAEVSAFVAGHQGWITEASQHTEHELSRFFMRVEIRAESLPRMAIEAPPDLVRALELQNLLVVGEMVARAALLRTESRGGHYREDYPDRDDAHWLRAIEVRREGTEMRLESLPGRPLAMRESMRRYFGLMRKG